MPSVEKQEVSKLNEYAQKYSPNKILPKYNFVDKMVQNNKNFIAECTYEGHITHGTAFTKQEAKRLAAGEMLDYLYKKNNLKFDAASRIVQNEPLISNKLEDFNRSDFDIFLNKYLDDREKNYSKFRQLSVVDSIQDSLQIGVEMDLKTYKSKTLDELKVTGMGAVNFTNACHIFKMIMQEMKLIYYAEFLETSCNDRYNVIIKLNINLLSFSECGVTPDEAIQAACKDAIEKLHIFNQ